MSSCCASGSRAFLVDVSKVSQISSRFNSPRRPLRVLFLSINRPVARKPATYLQIVVMLATGASAGCRKIYNRTFTIGIWHMSLRETCDTLVFPLRLKTVDNIRVL